MILFCRINPNAKRLKIDIRSLPRRRLVLSMRMGRGLINGHDFSVNPYTVKSHVGTYEVWEIINQSGMDHPFHQHVNPSQILSIRGGNPDYPSLYASILMEGTIIVPKWWKPCCPVKDFSGRRSLSYR
jgi:FtsP/CotA-like multicopper oxidase with cupredoxin domain